MHRGRRNATSATGTNAPVVTLRRGVSGRRSRLTRNSADANMSCLARGNDSSPIGLSYLSSDSSLSSLSSGSSSSSSSPSRTSGLHRQSTNRASPAATEDLMVTTGSRSGVSRKSHRAGSRHVTNSTQVQIHLSPQKFRNNLIFVFVPEFFPPVYDIVHLGRWPDIHGW